LPAWMDILPTQRLKLRLAGRIAYPKNYLAADVLIRGLRAAMRSGRAALGDDGWYERPVRAAFLAMLVLAMAWLVATSLHLPRGPWLALSVVALAASSIVRLDPLVPMPANGMHPISTYGPRGSVTIMALAVLFSFAGQRPILTACSALLLVLWHAGLGLIALPAFAIAFLVAGRAPACHTARPWAHAAAVLIPWAFGLLLLSKASCVIPVTQPEPPRIVYAPNPLVTGLSALALAALACGCARTRFAARLDPRNETLFLGSLVFLAVCQAAVCVQRSLAVCGLTPSTRVHLLYEIPARISGIEYVVGAAVGVLALWLVFRAAAARFELLRGTFLGKPLGQGVAVALLAVTLVTGRMDTYATALGGRANFFASDCSYVQLQPVTRDTLVQLDPRLEPEFFYALAEFLSGEH
jgi:hypothetical protein